MASFVCGAAFGAAMLAADFHKPGVILSQFNFEHWHMMETFMVGTAGTSIVYHIAERLGYAKIRPRCSTSLGLFSPYDGNILGGALLGAGMALSSACPGTVLAQVAAGTRSGFFALGGAILGGIAWTGVLSNPVKRCKEQTSVEQQHSTLHDKMGLSRGATLFLFEVACLAFVAATTLVAPRFNSATIPGATAGLFIVSAQLLSLLARRSMVGVSSTYEELGNYFWWLVKGGDAKSRPRAYQSILFAIGMVTGASALFHTMPAFSQNMPAVDVPPVLAAAGGMLLVLGARLAGGCPSGHGLSGISLLSTASITTIATSFMTGGLIAPFVKRLS